MNNQKAIARLQAEIYRKREKIKFNETFFPKQNNDRLKEDIEVYEFAISAIEKQHGNYFLNHIKENES